MNKIVEMFINNIKGRRFIKNCNCKHDGSEGHWLEGLMGIKKNSSNKPDLLGYEMKKSSSKISFGDWRSSCYLFEKTNKKQKFGLSCDISINKKTFLMMFGQYNREKDRYSWSGKYFPKYGDWNQYGQRFIFDENNNLFCEYSFNHDERNEKINIVSDYFRKDPVILAIWTREKLERHVNNKFNVEGFFICAKNKKTGIYEKICFGKKIDFQLFVDNFKKGIIFLDSGMTEGKSRYYSIFHASKHFFNSLIVAEF